MGGDRNEVWRFTATITPKMIGSIWKVFSKGRKIGTKMTMISVHSSGQPRKKMMNIDIHRKPLLERPEFKTHSSSLAWEPRRAKTAAKRLAPTKSQQTMAVTRPVS